MASIIDTLMVVFKADTSGLKAGIKEANLDLEKVKKSLKGVSEENEKAVKEVDKSGKGIEKAGKKAKESQKGFKEFGGSINGLRSSFLSLRSALALGLGGLGLLKLNNANVAIGNLSQVTGQGVGNIKALQNQFEKAGFSAQDADAAIKGFSNALGSAKYKGDPSGLVLPSILGVGVTDKNGKLRDAAEILLDMGEAARKLTGSEQEAAIMMEQYGISASAAYIATRNNARELYDQEKKNNNLTEAQVENSKRFNAQLSEIKQNFERVGQQGLEVVAPMLGEVGKGFETVTKLASENKDVTKAFFVGIAAWSLAAAGPLGIFAGAVLALSSVIHHFKEEVSQVGDAVGNSGLFQWLKNKMEDAGSYGEALIAGDGMAYDASQDSRLKKSGGRSSSAALSPGEAKIADMISQAESPSGYGSVARMKGDQGITKMTIAEVMEKHKGAVGRYQMIPSTLKEATRALRISPNAQFDERTQDELFKYIIHKKRPAIGAYLNGGGSQQEAWKAMAQEWAGIPMQNGLSYYHGDKYGNRATIQTAQVYEALKRGSSSETNNTNTTTITNHNNIQVASPQQAVEVVNKLPETTNPRIASGRRA